MSSIDEQDLIDRVTRRLQMMLAVSVVGLVVMLIVFAVLLPKGVGGALRGQGAVRGQAAGAKAGHPPAQASAYRANILDWLVVAVAGVSLTLSVVLPRWIVTSSRRQIAAGTWYSQSRRWVGEDGRLDELLRHAAIRSDRGQLAYVCITQYSFRWLLVPVFFLVGPVFMSTRSPIVLAMGVLLACRLVAWFPTRTRVENWIDRQEEALIQERELAVIEPPQDTRIGKGQPESRNRAHRDDGSSGVEDEVCGWLMEGAGAEDLDRPRELPDQDRQAAGLRRQRSGAGRIANFTSDAAAPSAEPAASLVSELKALFAPAPGLDPWEKVRVSLAIALVYNLFVGLFVSLKLYGADPKLAGWGGWLFLAPFILFGVGMLAAFAARLVVAIKFTRAEKSSRSRRTRSRGARCRMWFPGARPDTH